MPEYQVKQGECISSIAQKHGLFWEKVWEHPKNAQLKEKRKDPNVLYAGDVVFVPDKEENEESCATEQRHRFRKKGVPAMLRLQLFDEDESRANEPFILEIDGEPFTGTTDGEGRLNHPIPPTAKRGRLLVGETQDEYVLNLGHVDPIHEITGVQARLKNLGFGCGKIDGILGPKTEAALSQFQKKYGLLESGKLDTATEKKLVEVHGC
ncbi:MAG: peptidoglycan-binding protein [Desulfobacteraceae bacterium]|nr:MAG: peptidoglycan-binding protein [Desulfobacteraceae bacterium]